MDQIRLDPQDKLPPTPPRLRHIVNKTPFPPPTGQKSACGPPTHPKDNFWNSPSIDSSLQLPHLFSFFKLPPVEGLLLPKAQCPHFPEPVSHLKSLKCQSPLVNTVQGESSVSMFTVDQQQEEYYLQKMYTCMTTIESTYQSCPTHTEKSEN